MKNRVLTALVAGLCCVATTFGQVPSYVPTNGLVGYWPFNGNANDESGNGNTLVNNGGSFISDRNGLENNALSLVSVGTNLKAKNVSPSLTSSAQTISYWLKLPSQYHYSTLTLFSNGVAYTNGSHLYLDQNDGAYGTNNYIIGILIGNGQSTSFKTNQTELGNWCSVVTTYDGGTIKIYFNGILKSSLPYNGGIIQPNNDLLFANWGNPSVPANTGRHIDDIGIWNRALTQQEITALYQGCNVVATINSQSATTFCQGGSVTLQANTGNNYTYEWYKNSTLINGANQSVYAATTSGNYTVKVIDETCNATSSPTTVTVNSNPSVTLASIGAFTNYTTSPIPLNGSPSGGTYSGPGVTGNTFNPKQAGLGTRKITYSYTNSNNCSGTAGTSTIVYDTLGTTCTNYTTVTDTLVIKATLAGLNPPNNENTLKVYPNPASTHITIDNDNFAKMAGYSIVIENNAGQQVFQSTINQAQFYLDLSTLTGNGLYFVHLIDPSGATVTVRKIVLQ